jgi:hypothetical protein
MREISQTLSHHFLFIDAHNEFSHLTRSNHYLSNILGLFCISAYLRTQPISVRRSRYATLLQEEIRYQVNEDGGDYEASTGYHVLVTQMFLIAGLLMLRCNIPVDPTFWSRLRSMFRFIAEIASRHGLFPQIGDCDDGRVELLPDDLHQLLQAPDSRYSLVVKDLLGVGEMLFREPYFGRTWASEWYAIDRSNIPDLGPTSMPSTVQLFPVTGIAVARNEEAQIIFAAMPNGIHGHGSHTHNDKLSIVLRINDQDVLCDSGTFCYTRDLVRRNIQRSTSAHNTVIVDREEQNRIPLTAGGAFRILSDAHPSPFRSHANELEITLTASHDGYARIGVMHERSISLRNNQLSVTDVFTGTGSHFFEVMFHISPSWNLRTHRNQGQTVECMALGTRPLIFAWNAECSLDLLIRDSDISHSYGHSLPAKAIVVSTQSRVPFQLITTVSW